MTRDEYRQLICTVLDLFSERQRCWWQASSERRERFFQMWWGVLQHCNHSDCVSAVEELKFECAPFEGRWEFVGQMIRARALHYSAERLRIQDRKKLEQASIERQRRLKDRSVNTGEKGMLELFRERLAELEHGRDAQQEQGEAGGTGSSSGANPLIRY